jgi:hypothetical protein
MVPEQRTRSSGLSAISISRDGIDGETQPVRNPEPVSVPDGQRGGAVHDAGASPSHLSERIEGHLTITIGLKEYTDFSIAPTWCIWTRIEAGKGSFQPVRFSVTYPLISHPSSPDFLTRDALKQFCQTAELSGFDGIGFTDHPAPTAKWLRAGGHDALDPFVTLSLCAAVTERIRLITNIVVLP